MIQEQVFLTHPMNVQCFVLLSFNLHQDDQTGLVGRKQSLHLALAQTPGGNQTGHVGIEIRLHPVLGMMQICLPMGQINQVKNPRIIFLQIATKLS